MNIADGREATLKVIAKTCRYAKEGEQNEGNKKIAYLLIDNFYSLCIDKKDIILSELEACKQLSRYDNLDEDDRKAIETEIFELKMILKEAEKCLNLT